MAIYVDKIQEYPVKGQAKKFGNEWCHMYADTVEELHEMAERMGLKKSWFQDKRLKHYDLTPGMRQKAINLGAVEDLDRKPFMRILNKA